MGEASQQRKVLQIIPTAFDAEDWLETTGAKCVQLWMEVPGEPGYFEEEVQQVDLGCPDGCWDKVEYSEFFWWRFKQIFGSSNEFSVVTPDMVDEYFKEPEDPMQVRCRRCLSTKVVVGYPCIECLHCGYSEPLIDFPISRHCHLALEKEFSERSSR